MGQLRGGGGDPGTCFPGIISILTPLKCREMQNQKIARFLERSTRRKKPGKRRKPSVRLEIKRLFNNYRWLYYLSKCASTLLMIIVTFVRYELMRFLLKFFATLVYFYILQHKRGAAPPHARSLYSLA